MKLLLAKKEVDSDIPDEDRTPLSLAAEMGQEGVIELLSKREDVNFNMQDDDGRVGTRESWDYFSEGKT